MELFNIKGGFIIAGATKDDNDSFSLVLRESNNFINRLHKPPPKALRHVTAIFVGNPVLGRGGGVSIILFIIFVLGYFLC